MALTMSSFGVKLTKLRVGTKERLKIYNKIASFMEEGIDLQNILEQLSLQFEKTKKGDPRAKMLSEWNESISAGRSLSHTIADWVPPSEAMVIKSGERSGNIAVAFRNASLITESSSKMVGTLVSAMAYPVLLVTALIGLIVMFAVNIIPDLTALAPPEEWPDISYSLYEASNLIRNKWWALLLGVFGLSYAVAYSLPRLTGKARDVLDKIPPYNIYKTFQSSAFLISTAAMLKTGVPIVDAITDIKNMSPKYSKLYLQRMLNLLDTGKSIGPSINSGFLDKETGMDVEIYSELRGLDKSMERIGLNAIENSINSINVAAGLMKNLVIILIAVTVGWVFFAINTLTQSINSGLNAGM